MGRQARRGGKDTFGKATDEAIRKALDLIKSEKANIIVLGKRGRPTKYSPKLCVFA